MPASSICCMTAGDDHVLAIAQGVNIDLDGVFEKMGRSTPGVPANTQPPRSCTLTPEAAS